MTGVGDSVDTRFARQYYESAAVDHWWFVGRRTLVEMALERYWSGTGAVVDLGAGAVSLFPEESRPIKLDVVRPPDVSDRFVQASAESLPFRVRLF